MRVVHHTSIYQAEWCIWLPAYDYCAPATWSPPARNCFNDCLLHMIFIVNCFSYRTSANKSRSKWQPIATWCSIQTFNKTDFILYVMNNFTKFVSFFRHTWYVLLTLSRLTYYWVINLENHKYNPQNLVFSCLMQSIPLTYYVKIHLSNLFLNRHIMTRNNNPNNKI